jgi:hypothetical protein
MDLIAALRDKIEVLDKGDYIAGLKAVLLHIETAFRYWSRGRETGEDTLFTDAIYRANQAFEGSIKEAFRVLANQDPSRKRPFEIENYLEKNDIFRNRVLKQFTRYRTEWRNPSVHDHKLDFDESEAFLGIVTVTAFAYLLLDLIAEQLSFEQTRVVAEAQKDTTSNLRAGSKKVDILVRAVSAIQKFCDSYVPSIGSARASTEAQIIGSLHGFLASTAPDITVQIQAALSAERRYRADLLLSDGTGKLIVEVKRLFQKKNIENVVGQMEHYMRVGGVKKAIVLFMPEERGHFRIEERRIRALDGRIMLFIPGETGKPQ